MFTDVAHRQPGHHFCYPQHSVRQSDFDGYSLNQSPTDASQFGHRNLMRNSGFRQRLQRPEQYAHPLHLPSSLTTQIPNSEPYQAIPDASEHMLRRKTPNGTLAAGYDGRPVEWTSRPHAMKHYLMPVSKSVGEAMYTSIPAETLEMYPPERKDLSFSARAEEQRYRVRRNSIGRCQSAYENRDDVGNFAHTPEARRPDTLSAPGLDSVLHQSSLSHHYNYFAGGPQVPTVLQPMWPPCLGLTSLNNSGPYGPYWADGAFVPYRPAPLRDPRYQCRTQGSHVDGAAQLQLALNKHADWSRGGSNVDRMDWTVYSSDLAHHHQSSANHSVPEAEILRRRENFPASLEMIPTQQPEANRLVYRVKPLPPKPPGVRAKTSWERGQRPSISGPSPVQQAKYQEPDRQATNAHFKEKVLVWAHRIYLSLLACVHQSRRAASHTQRHGERHPQPNIYPKPPRQLSSPSSAFQGHAFLGQNSPQSSSGPLHNGDGMSSHHLSSLKHISGPPRTSPEDFAGMFQPSTPQNGQSVQSWQLNGQYVSPACPTPGRDHLDQRRSLMSPPIREYENSPACAAAAAIELLNRLCQESGWEWTDGLLLGGCLAYGLGDYEKALEWYSKVLNCDPNNVEAMSNLAATLLSLNRRAEAEHYWLRSVKLRPSYFEAVEHLVGLLCEDHRGKEAVKTIEFVEQALRTGQPSSIMGHSERYSESASEASLSPSYSISERSDFGFVEQESGEGRTPTGKSLKSSSFHFSGYSIPPSENGRILALVHGKGNMLYALGDNAGAAKAFEDAILIGAGQRQLGIRGLIRRILRVCSDQTTANRRDFREDSAADNPILLVPEMALETSHLVFPSQGQLPGLKDVAAGVAKKSAILIISNSLLSLAKIYQDGMSSSGASATGPRAASGVQDILALYYLSLSLQPSPSTANNVGILLASVQQSSPTKLSMRPSKNATPIIPGVLPGSGVALALAYYNFGLNLDNRHAHLYTNLGSLFKDIGQLNAAIKMYEKAVDCDGKFDIALANLANAVKDQGRISDAIVYYRRAVASNPEFAEAVCGLANALNSVCSWLGRGGIKYSGGKRDRWHVDEQGMLYDARISQNTSSGWIVRVVAIVEKQLRDGEGWGKGVLNAIDTEFLLEQLVTGYGRQDRVDHKKVLISRALQVWAEQPWEGAKVVRLVERATKRLGWQAYWKRYIHRQPYRAMDYTRPQLPTALAIPSAPTVLPFHTFTCPLSAKQIRRISQRNGLRISCSTLRAPWLPTRIYDPPAPPEPHLNVGYVSSDFNNHPLAHLMQSVFGYHNPNRVRAFCYATTASDGSVHRHQIEREAPVFLDVSSWSIDRLVNQIVSDGIHILVNLNGYTRGAKNEVFAARPAPVQMSFMGFAGTLGAEWCDYLLADKIAVPPQTLRPWRRNVDLIDQTNDGNNSDDNDDWVYGENIVYTKDTFFCCDHRQSAPDSQEVQLTWPEEQQRRWRMRKELFPDLPDDMIILGNFNQLYKIEPTTFRTWLRILSRIPKAILWLLRFPNLGETNLKQTALLWVGSEVASRIRFTDVAPKHQHISRARVCDLFLDTPECNAHTTAADVLWSGTPLMTLPRYEYKMCSRMAASILRGALPKTAEGDRAAEQLTVRSDEEYEERAVELGSDLVYMLQRGQEGFGRGRLAELRKLLYESRWTSALFDTRRWVRDLEVAYEEAWNRWVAGEGGDIWL